MEANNELMVSENRDLNSRDRMHGRYGGRFPWHECSANFDYTTKSSMIVPGERRSEDMEHIPENQADKRSPDTEKSLEALEQFTLPLVEHFIKALKNEDKWVRYLAAESLGNMGDLRAIAHLNLLQSDEDPDLRFVSDRSLDKIVRLRQTLADSGKKGCETCLIRYIAEEVLVQRDRTRP